MWPRILLVLFILLIGGIFAVHVTGCSLIGLGVGAILDSEQPNTAPASMDRLGKVDPCRIWMRGSGSSHARASIGRRSCAASAIAAWCSRTRRRVSARFRWTILFRWRRTRAPPASRRACSRAGLRLRIRIAFASRSWPAIRPLQASLRIASRRSTWRRSSTARWSDSWSARAWTCSCSQLRGFQEPRIGVRDPAEHVRALAADARPRRRRRRQPDPDTAITSFQEAMVRAVSRTPAPGRSGPRRG